MKIYIYSIFVNVKQKVLEYENRPNRPDRVYLFDFIVFWFGSGIFYVFLDFI